MLIYKMSKTTIEVKTFREHALSKSMWAGSTLMSMSREVLFSPIDNKLEYKDIEYPGALLQIFTEIFTNAIDQKTRYPDLVKNIKVTLDKVTGEISVYNDGKGFDIEIVKGTNQYTPEVAYSSERAGSNFDANATIITGGTNGYGAKLTNVYSDKFTVETVGRLHNNTDNTWVPMRYTQTFSDNMAVIGEPVMVPATSSEYTVVKFRPSYEKVFEIKQFNTFINSFETLLYTRIKFMASWFTDKSTIFHYNGKIYAKSDVNEFGNMVSQMIKYNSAETTQQCTFVETIKFDDRCSWIIYIVVSSSQIYIPTVNLVNSIFNYSSDHQEKLRKKIIAILRNGNDESPRLDSIPNIIKNTSGFDIKPSIIDNKIYVYSKVAIDSKYFTTQSKTTQAIDNAKMKNVVFNSSTIISIHNKVLEYINLFDKNEMIKKNIEKAQKDQKTRKVVNDKYKPARYLMNTNSVSSKKFINPDGSKVPVSLFLVEGDSAMGFITTGIRESRMNYDYNGVFSVQGVITNVRKGITKTLNNGSGIRISNKDGLGDIEEQIMFKNGGGFIDEYGDQQDADENDVDDDNNDDNISVRSDTASDIKASIAKSRKKANSSLVTSIINSKIADITCEIKGKKSILENAVLNDLQDVLGLIREKRDYSNLHYNQIVITTDRDLDGIGNIAGLIVNWIHYFWPDLFQMGFVKMLLTPIVQCIPRIKSKINTVPTIDFGLEYEYKMWDLKTDDAIKNKYVVKYYKGLAEHTDSSCRGIFVNIAKYVYTYSIGEGFNQTIETYFGNDPSLRKVELAKPIVYLNDAQNNELTKTRIYSGIHHLNIDTKSYQQDNLVRKLPNAIDGFIIGRRKAVYGGIELFGPNSTPIKVFQMSGDLIKKSHYHHGDSSMNKMIIYMAQGFLGARDIPLFMPIGQFGTREGTIDGIGSDAGSPRYLHTLPNHYILNTLFPRRDDSILTYVRDDGKLVQPEFYVPILPHVILATETIPSHGWQQSRWARDVHGIVNATKHYITNGNFAGDLISRVCSDYKCEHKVFKKQISTDHTVDYNLLYVTPKIVPSTKTNYVIVRFDDVIPRISGAKFKSNLVKILRGNNGASSEDYINADIYLITNNVNNAIVVEIELNTKQMEILNKRIADDNWKSHALFGCLPNIVLLFQSYISMTKHLNFVCPHNPYAPDGQIVVKEFKSYKEVFIYWYEIRKNYYKMRCERLEKLLRLSILYETFIIKYIMTQITDSISNLTDVEFAQYVVKHKLIPFNERSIATIKSDIPTSSLYTYFLGEHNAKEFVKSQEFQIDMTDNVKITHNATSNVIEPNYQYIENTNINYEYILNIKSKQLMRDGVKLHQQRLDSNIAELAELLTDTVPFIGARQWLAEIDAFKVAYDNGKNTKWIYEHE